MFNRYKKNMTPAAQANKAQTNIFVRIIGCGFLVYIIRELLTSEDFSTSNFWMVALVAFMGLAGFVIIVLTIIELIRNIKNGVYTAKYYDTAESEEQETILIDAEPEKTEEPEDSSDNE